MTAAHRQRERRFHIRRQALGIDYERYDVVLPHHGAQPQPAHERAPALEVDHVGKPAPVTPPRRFPSSAQVLSAPQEPLTVRGGVEIFAALLLVVVLLLGLLYSLGSENALGTWRWKPAEPSNPSMPERTR